MRLSTSLLGLLAVTALVLSGTVYAGFALHKDDVVGAEVRSLEATAEGISESLATRIEEMRLMVELGAAQPGAGAFETDRPRRAVERFVSKSHFDGATIVTANGTMVAIASRELPPSRRRALVGNDFGDRTYVQEALEGNTYVGNTFVAESGNHVMVVSTPVRRDGRVVGTFNGAIHLRRTSVFTSLSRSLKEGQSLLVRRNGRPVYRQGAAPESFLVVIDEVEGSNWSVVVGQSRASVEGPLRAASAAQAGAVGVALVTVALVGWWIYRATIGNLNHLIDGLTSLEAGDYDSEVDLGETQEWSRISAQFNALAETLDQRDSQLRVLNRVLRHNLRNDMSVIVACADTLLHDADEDEATEDVERIRRTATNLLRTSEHARAIYEKFLDEGNFETTPVDAADVVETEAEELRAEFPESTIAVDVPSGANTYDGDTLPVVVNELARNGLLHNDRPPAEREVHLAVEDDGEWVTLRVRDNGPGLPDIEARLLTGSIQETNFEHGSGLGLWLVNWLVDRLDGEVSVTSAGDRGTTVTVRLPAVGEREDVR